LASVYASQAVLSTQKVENTTVLSGVLLPNQKHVGLAEALLSKPRGSSLIAPCWLVGKYGRRLVYHNQVAMHAGMDCVLGGFRTTKRGGWQKDVVIYKNDRTSES